MTRNAFTERLREAGLTAEEFADIVQVDPKTVQRWVAGRTPQRRHRPKVARALDTPEDVLWPAELATPDAPSAIRERERRVGGDVVASWGWADDHDAPTPVEFLTANDGPVDLMDTGGELLQDDRLIAALIKVAGERSPVRVLVDAPRRNLMALIGVAQLGLRVADSIGSCAVLRVGDRMLAYLDMPRVEVESQRPLLELKLAGDRDLFTRLASTIDALWDRAGDPVTEDAQLDDHLHDAPGIREPRGEDNDAPGGRGRAGGASRSSDREAEPAEDRGAAPPRRWPRRPDRT